MQRIIANPEMPYRFGVLSDESAALEEGAVGGDFLFEFERVGARGGGQAGKAEFAVVEVEGESFASF